MGRREALDCAASAAAAAFISEKGKCVSFLKSIKLWREVKAWMLGLPVILLVLWLGDGLLSFTLGRREAGILDFLAFIAGAVLMAVGSVGAGALMVFTVTSIWARLDAARAFSRLANWVFNDDK